MIEVVIEEKRVALTEEEVDLWTVICQDSSPKPHYYIVLRGRLLAKLGVSTNYGAIKRAIETGFVYAFKR